MLLNPYSIFTSIQIHPLMWAHRYVPQKYKAQLCQSQGEHWLAGKGLTVDVRHQKVLPEFA